MTPKAPSQQPPQGQAPPDPAPVAASTSAATGGYITKGAQPATGTLSTEQAAWLVQMEPYAQQAAAATGLTEQLILAQWANETAWGTSYAYKVHHNLAGIGITTAHATGLVAPTLEAGVQAYITEMNNNPDYASVRSAGQGLTTVKKTQAQAAALAASPWAGGHYTGGAGLPLSLVTKSLSNVSGVEPGKPTMGVVGAGTGNVQTATPNAGATASANIDAVLRAAGLTSLIGWANNLATTLTAKGLSASAIGTEVVTRMQSTPATVAIFNARFPGLNTRVKNGFPAISVTEYLTYEDKAKQMGAAAGLPDGFMTNTEIGKLVANNVSLTELSTRLTKAYQVAMNAPQETRTLLTHYFGVKTGGLAAYFLTPKKATAVLQNQVTAAQIGTAAYSTGFKSYATAKVEPYATAGKPAPTGRPGKASATPLHLAQVGVSSATAQDTFQSLAKLLPLTEGLPGTGGEKTSLGQNTLVNYGFFGTNAEELQNVEQARTSPFRGGGGYAETAKGVVGAGYGSSQGTGT